MLMRKSTNSLEIHKLQVASSKPRLEAICTLGLPPLKPDACICMSTIYKEWIATSDLDRHTGSQIRQRRLPFRSSRNNSVALFLGYGKTSLESTGANQLSIHIMVVSVAAILSVAHSGVRKSSWENWGPLATRIIPFKHNTLLAPVGPFWITSLSPLTVRDYDPLRAMHVLPEIEDTSSPSTSTLPSPMFDRSKAVCKYWLSGYAKTRLPYRKFMSRDINISQLTLFIGDREWLIAIRETVRGFCTSTLLIACVKSLTRYLAGRGN